jgi:protein-disulfide isomerase
MKTLAAITAVAILALGALQPATAQSRTSTARQLRELREEVRKVREVQEAMQRDLQELKRLLEAARAERPPAPGLPAFVSSDDDPFLGSADAKVVMIDFSEFQCPFCGRFTRDTKPQLEKEYFNTGKVKYVFRDLPLEAIHPHAFKAAEAANCAGKQGKYWEMHERLFQNPRTLDTPNLERYAQSIELDMDRFSKCLESGEYAAEIRKDMADAEAANIQGTPNFVIGLANPKDPRDTRIKVLKVITGAHPYASFKKALDAALAEAEQN